MRLYIHTVDIVGRLGTTRYAYILEYVRTVYDVPRRPTTEILRQISIFWSVRADIFELI
jgi:hypothetical protein